MLLQESFHDSNLDFSILDHENANRIIETFKGRVMDHDLRVYEAYTDIRSKIVKIL